MICWKGLGWRLGEQVYITGGGTRSALWTRIRAAVLGKTLLQPEVTETAFGAAILAAAGAWYGSVSQAARAMVRIAGVVEPDPGLKGQYNEKYLQFLSGLKKRRY